ncbi:molybdopterin-guanine dinucleotide biosynthesis protein B [Pseudoneobacillus sp. C159]
MVKHPLILQVVGFQNSGKTTFIKQLLEMLSIENIRAGVIKHHGHGGKPDIYEEKDSATYCHKGAAVSLVEGEGRVLIQAEQPQWTLEEQIKLLVPFKLDIILIEGHKNESHPKIFIVRNPSDLEKLNQLSNIMAIFLRDRSLIAKMNQNTLVPYFMLDNNEHLIWTFHFIRALLGKSVN